MGIGKSKVMPTLAVTDLKRAREFYEKTLGLKEVRSFDAEGDVLYDTGEESYLYIYERSKPSGSTATVCAFSVEDVEKTVEKLREQGVDFEEYDIPEMNLKTVNGIATESGIKTAWFKDPSGNILALDDALAATARKKAAA